MADAEKKLTLVLDSDCQGAVAGIQIVVDALAAIPDGKAINLSADAQAAVSAVQAVGESLSSATDGKSISVTADVSGAVEAIQSVDENISEDEKSIRVTADVQGAVDTVQDFSVRAVPEDLSISLTADVQSAVEGVEVVEEKIKAAPDGKRFDLSASGQKAISEIGAVDRKLKATPDVKRINVIADVDAAIARIEKVNKKVESAAGSLTDAFGGMGGLAGIVTIGGAAKVLGDVAKKGDEIADGAKRLQVTTDEYQRLDFAAQRSGTGIGSVEQAFKRMNNVLDGADEESKGAQKSLDRLGLTLEDFGGKSQEQKFSMISERLRNIKDATERAALANQIFGRDAQSLLPMINDYESLKQELDDIGGIMSKENVEAADRLADSVKNLTTQFTSLVANSGILNFLAKAAEGMNAVTANAKRMEGINAGGAYAHQGFFSNLADAYFGETEGTKIYSAGPSDAAVKAKLDEKNAPKPKTKIEDISDRGAAIENEIAALEGRRNASAMDSEKLMFQGEINKKMEQYKELLKEAAAAGIKEADIQLKKINDTERAKKAMEDIVGEMRQQIFMQDMLAAGKNREAYIQGELYKLQKTHPDRANTPAEEKKISDLANTIFTGKADKAENDALAEMREQLRMQELINAGKGKQAFIDETLAKLAKERGEALTDEAKIREVSDLAGQLYDSRNKVKTEGIGQPEAPNVDSFAKLGLYNFGEGVSKSLDVERNSLLKQIAAKVGLPVIQEVLA